VFLLLLRFCAYFSLQTFKKEDKYLAPPEIFSVNFFRLPGCIGLATALFRLQSSISSAVANFASTNTCVKYCLVLIFMFVLSFKKREILKFSKQIIVID